MASLHTIGPDMRRNGPSRRTVQFGAFELAMHTGELRKNGVRVKLQGKPFQLLQALLERSGEVVTREELQRRLWPEDTFVDFESGLNTTANRLRIALGDSAENPRFIETLARTGYRFVAPIQESAAAPPEPEIQEEAPETTVPAPEPKVPRRRWSLRVPIGIAAAVAIASGCFLLWPTSPAEKLQFRQLTFRRGPLLSARFTPDSQTIIYSAHWANEKPRLYMVNSFSPESRPLDFFDAGVIGISRKGELAFLQHDPESQYVAARLCRVPLNGGAPRAVGQRIFAADWSPDGESFATLRGDGGFVIVEYPPAKISYRSTGWITDLRVSPGGNAVAFIEHPFRMDDRGSVMMVAAGGAPKVLAPGWASASGLAWSPSGKEVWFTATRSGVLRSLYAASRGGNVRLVYRVPGALRLFDISRDGRVLLSRDTLRLTMASSDGKGEHDLSWFDWSRLQAISADDKLVLFDESGEGGGQEYGVYIHNMITGETTHVGSGTAQDLSTDGNWALTLSASDRHMLRLIPLGPGQAQVIPGHGIEYQWARLLPDGKRLIAGGSVAGKDLQVFLQPLSGEKPVPVKPEKYLDTVVVSPDGKRVAGVNTVLRLEILPLDGSASRVIEGPLPLFPIRWSSKDPDMLYARGSKADPLKLFRVHVNTGKVEYWKSLETPDAMGMQDVSAFAMSSDEKLYVYSKHRMLSELFLIDGWH